MASGVLRVWAGLPRSACTDLGRRAWQVDADGPLGLARRGLAAGARFEMSRCARVMGKERPGETVHGPNVKGRTSARGAGAAAARPARDRVDVPRFECVFLKNFE
jgi:hypothetical protein